VTSKRKKQVSNEIEEIYYRVRYLENAKEVVKEFGVLAGYKRY